jgi:peptidoglycan/xylan/chitin deacetylase (PgdA/CDA1 family)
VPNAPAGSAARIGTAQYPIAGTNIARAADALVLYTRAGGQTVSPANMWGEEIAVLNGTITAIRDRQSTGAAAMPIPDGGYVLSGHGAARTWLVTHARVGGTVTITTGTPTPTSTPTPTPSPTPTPTPSGSCPAGSVRLTFDDGPVATGSTASVLDTLRRYGRTATFFMVGGQAQGNPDLVRRVAAEGHRIGNHTWDHPSLPGLSDAEIRSQLTRTSDTIEQLTGRRPTEWRPPYGEWDERVRWNANAVGLGTMTLWDVDTLDWQGPSPEVIRDRVVAGAYDGATVLMHDRIANTATALPMVLDGLAARGFCTR